jgi:hypothetical protein
MENFTFSDTGEIAKPTKSDAKKRDFEIFLFGAGTIQ